MLNNLKGFARFWIMFVGLTPIRGERGIEDSVRLFVWFLHLIALGWSLWIIQGDRVGDDHFLTMASNVSWASIGMALTAVCIYESLLKLRRCIDQSRRLMVCESECGEG